MKALAASISVMPASLSSLTNRSCSVPKRPLRTAPRLRRIGANMFDPQLRQRPADLGRTAAIDLAGLGGAKVVRAAVRIEAHRQAVLGENLLQRPEGGGCGLLLDKTGRIET